jgi:hypothetical protein
MYCTMKYEQAFVGRDAIAWNYIWRISTFLVSPDEEPLVETSKFSLYFSGSCIPNNETCSCYLHYLHWEKQYCTIMVLFRNNRTPIKCIWKHALYQNSGNGTLEHKMCFLLGDEIRTLSWHVFYHETYFFIASTCPSVPFSFSNMPARWLYCSMGD